MTVTFVPLIYFDLYNMIKCEAQTNGILNLSIYSSTQLLIYWPKHLLCAANKRLFLFS